MAKPSINFSYTADGLANALTGAGTTVDRRMHSLYVSRIVTPEQVLTSYRDSWLMRKIVDLPPLDMTRERRDWQADKEKITAIEKAEKAFGIWAKVKAGLIMGRLGGGAIIIGLSDNSPDKPLPKIIKPGQLLYLHLVSRHELTLGENETDLLSANFGKPKYFRLNSATGEAADIHPSRVVTFHGNPVPTSTYVAQEDAFWGDPVYRAVIDAVQNADTAQSGFASLIDEAKIDVFMMDLVKALGEPDGEARVKKRLDIVNQAKSIHRALILDKDDKWDQKQVTWTGMPEVTQLFLAIVAGAADIPATRLLGKSPDGMNATGEADAQNYRDMIGTRQEDDLRPILERLDRVVLPSAGIALDGDEYWTFAPISRLSEKDQADVEKKRADTAKVYADSGLIPVNALSKGVQNALIESGTYPGLEQALEDEPDVEPVEEGDLEEQAKGGRPETETPFDDGYNPRQPRGKDGRWVSSGAKFAQSAIDDKSVKGGERSGPISTKVRQRLQALGIKSDQKSVGLDADYIRHTYKRHGHDSRGQKAISPVDIGRAHIILNSGIVSNGNPPTSSSGARRIHVSATVMGEKYSAAFEARKHRIVLVSLRKKK